jgi:hypothetical protein
MHEENTSLRLKEQVPLVSSFSALQTVERDFKVKLGKMIHSENNGISIDADSLSVVEVVGQNLKVGPLFCLKVKTLFVVFFSLICCLEQQEPDFKILPLETLHDAKNSITDQRLSAKISNPHITHSLNNSHSSFYESLSSTSKTRISSLGL